MASQRFAGALLGIVFGFMLTWSGMVDPDVIRGALLIEESYLFLFMGSAVGTAAVGLALVRRFQTRAVLVDQRIGWTTQKPQRSHLLGSVIFGVGWGVSQACPGPVAAQVGQGVGWGVFTLIGIVIGVRIFLVRESAETEPAFDETRDADTAGAGESAPRPGPGRRGLTRHPPRRARFVAYCGAQRIALDEKLAASVTHGTSDGPLRRDT